MLRAMKPSDGRAWRERRAASRDFLVPWEPEWPDDCLTQPYFLRMLRRQDREWQRGKAYAFGVFLQGRGKKNVLIGGVALNDARRGIAQKATLGYWIGQDHAHRGFMTEAVGLACEFAFSALKLHRLEASCLPHNEPSIRLLQRLGFEEEGYAKSYLRVNGLWQDHVLWGKIAPLGILGRD
jgi:ribosomal-protein-alanine N-acetyltransferase